MNLIEMLKSSSEKLEETGETYIEKSLDFAKQEEQYKQIRAEVYNMDRVQTQPNQILRDSEADVIMVNHEKFKPLYDKYLDSKAASKKAWVRYEVRKEINENLRALVNNLTFMKGGKNE